MAYVQDLADADLLLRPVPGINHIAWQLGHLITGSKKMLGWLGHPRRHCRRASTRAIPRRRPLRTIRRSLPRRMSTWRWRQRSRPLPWRPLMRRRRASWTSPVRNRCGTMLPRLRPCDAWVRTGRCTPGSSSPSAASWGSRRCSSPDYSRTVGCVKRTAGKMVGYARSRTLENASRCSGPVRATHHRAGFPCSTHPTVNNPG